MTLLGVEASEALVRDYTARAKEALDSGRWLGNTSFLAELADRRWVEVRRLRIISCKARCMLGYPS